MPTRTVAMPSGRRVIRRERMRILPKPSNSKAGDRRRNSRYELSSADDNWYMGIVTKWEKLRSRHQDLGILLIAVWKLCRGAGLLVVGLWALAMQHDNCPPGMHGRFVNWCIHLLHLGSTHRSIHSFLVNHGVMQERNLQLLCIVASLYSVKLFAEGLGLWFEKVWAEYLTVVFTAMFLPVTIYELIQRITVIHLAALGVNILIVAYLACRLWRRQILP